MNVNFQIPMNNEFKASKVHLDTTMLAVSFKYTRTHNMILVIISRAIDK